MGGKATKEKSGAKWTANNEYSARGRVEWQGETSKGAAVSNLQSAALVLASKGKRRNKKQVRI